jgi:AraC-like DNA-binding protein
MILESTRYRIDEHRAQSFLDACRKAGGHLEFRGIRYELTRCADQPQWYTFRIEWESAQQQRRFLEDPAGKAFRDVVNSFERDVEERRQWYLTDVGRRSTAPAGGVPGPLPDRAPWNRLSPWIAEHIQGKIRVEEMAECVNMSPRNFARVFRREFGVPPGEFLDRLRVSAATQDLGDWTQSIEQIAATRGFGSSSTMRRAFLRVVGCAPSEFREKTPPRALPRISDAALAAMRDSAFLESRPV